MPRDSSIGTVAQRTVKASPGNILSLACTNLNAAVRYFQLFDLAAAPSGTPIEVFPVQPNGAVILDENYFNNKLDNRLSLFSVGITWGFSTTALTYTAGSATDAIVVVRFV